jgi:RNA-binding protein 25
MRERAVDEAQARDREEMGARLEVWDDDESDELFYTDRSVTNYLTSHACTQRHHSFATY